jgi:hypothetical protein
MAIKPRCAELVKREEQRAYREMEISMSVLAVATALIKRVQTGNALTKLAAELYISTYVQSPTAANRWHDK